MTHSTQRFLPTPSSSPVNSGSTIKRVCEANESRVKCQALVVSIAAMLYVYNLDYLSKGKGPSR